MSIVRPEYHTGELGAQVRTVGWKHHLDSSSEMLAFCQPQGCSDRSIVSKGNPDVIEWSAAHLMAHVALNHRSEPASSVRFLKTLAPAFLLIALMPTFLSFISGTPLSMLATAGIVFAVVIPLASRYLAARDSRAMERAADAQAAKWGYPVTDDVAMTLSKMERLPDRLPIVNLLSFAPRAFTRRR